MVNINGHDFEQITIRDSYYRRALQYERKILTYLKRFELTEDDVNIPIEQNAMRNVQASVAWYLDDAHLFFSYTGSSKFVENLAMVAQVIDYFSQRLIEGDIDLKQYVELFKEDYDISEKRMHAREVLGVHEDSKDFDEMNVNYRRLSKEYHPDMPTGNLDKFKEINNAHKILKKELFQQ